MLVPGTGLEPARLLRHWILSPARLPIPPSRRVFIVIQASGRQASGVGLHASGFHDRSIPVKLCRYD